MFHKDTYFSELHSYATKCGEFERLTGLVPPVSDFRQKGHATECFIFIRNFAKTFGMVSFNSIPTVDLSSFTTEASSDAARQEAAKQLARACHLNGCVGITGHGVPSELLKKGFEVAERLFDLPMEEKLKAPHPRGAVPHRGYSAPGMEKAYTKEDLEKEDDHREKLRKIVDCKVCCQQYFKPGF